MVESPVRTRACLRVRSAIAARWMPLFNAMLAPRICALARALTAKAFRHDPDFVQNGLAEGLVCPLWCMDAMNHPAFMVQGADLAIPPPILPHAVPLPPEPPANPPEGDAEEGPVAPIPNIGRVRSKAQDMYISEMLNELKGDAREALEEGALQPDIRREARRRGVIAFKDLQSQQPEIFQGFMRRAMLRMRAVGRARDDAGVFLPAEAVEHDQPLIALLAPPVPAPRAAIMKDKAKLGDFFGSHGK